MDSDTEKACFEEIDHLVLDVEKKVCISSYLFCNNSLVMFAWLFARHIFFQLNNRFLLQTSQIIGMFRIKMLKSFWKNGLKTIPTTEQLSRNT